MTSPSKYHTTADEGGSESLWETTSDSVSPMEDDSKAGGSFKSTQQSSRWPATVYKAQRIDEERARFALVCAQSVWGVYCCDTELFANLSKVDNIDVPDLPHIKSIKASLPKTTEQDKVAQLYLQMHKAAYLSGGCGPTGATGRGSMRHTVKAFTRHAQSLTLAAAVEPNYKELNGEGSCWYKVQKAPVRWVRRTSDHKIDPDCLSVSGLTEANLQESRPDPEQTDATSAADSGCEL